jgi:hypothetical protein
MNDRLNTQAVFHGRQPHFPGFIRQPVVHFVMDLDVGPVHSCWMPLSHFRHEELQYQAGLTTTTFNCVTFILGTLLTLALNPNFPDLDPATPVERMRMRNALVS